MHAERIHFRAEDGDSIGGCTEGLDALIAFHSVVETGCHAMDAEIWICYKDWVRPLAGFGGIVGFNVTVD